MNIKQKDRGFGLIELLAVLGVLTIILAVALPNFLGWRSNAQVRRVAEELREAAKLAKSKAIQENEIAVLDLDPDRNGLYDSYLAYVDSGNGSGGPSDWRHDPDEPVVYQQDVPENINIELIDPGTGNPADNYKPQGKLLADRLLRIAFETNQHEVQEKGVAGGLFPTNFHQSKIHFQESPTTEDWWQVLYDGMPLDHWIINTNIGRNLILFYQNGECMTPIRIIVINSDGEKLMLEITAWTITKITKIS